MICLRDSDDICGPKWCLKCPRNFRPSPWILPRYLFVAVEDVHDVGVKRRGLVVNFLEGISTDPDQQ